MADFRSDTVTQPTAAMREAMARAVVGDDVLDEDPTVRELEATTAEALGHEAGLFVPSGTMANVIAVALHVGRGDEILLEEDSHIANFERGGVAAIAGATPRLLPSTRGRIDPAVVEAAVRPANVHFVRTRALAIENTHNMHGGAIVPSAHMAALRTATDAIGMTVHLDGARLFNAVVATGEPASAFGALADTVSICLSKGLGAPVGSVLVADRARIAEARNIRKMLGGGMRQAGVIAAAGLIALRDGPGWLADDHRRARTLAEGVVAGARRAGLPEGAVEVVSPDTNMVFIRLSGRAGWYDPVLAHLRTRGIRALAVGAYGLRFVLHHQIDDAMVARAIDAVGEALSAQARLHPANRVE